MKDKLDLLLNEATALDRQVKIIADLNQNMFDAKTLCDVVLYLRDKMVVVEGQADAADVVGTGGDGFDTINFSTLGSIVAAAAGVKMAKHGNKGSTSKCGSFDLLSNLNVDLKDSSKGVGDQLDAHGLSFLFAPYFHPILKNVKEARKVFASRGEKTIFNCLGPLLNPASVEIISTGVYTPQLIEPYIAVLQAIGVKHAFVVHGSGMDEFTLTGPTQYARMNNGEIELGVFTPQDFGMMICAQSDLNGGDLRQNTNEALAILNNELKGPKVDMVLLQAASVIALKNETDILSAIDSARDALESGAALAKLKEISQ